MKTIQRSILNGKIAASASKSYTHRAVICASLAEGKSRINNILQCDDTFRTIDACKLLGAKIEQTNNNLIVKGGSDFGYEDIILNCGSSGTTARFFTSILSLRHGNSLLIGNSSLMKRPIHELVQSLQELGVKLFSIFNNEHLPIVIFGKGIDGGFTRITGKISSQFISSLLIACPLANKNTNIVVKDGLQSKPYVEMTIQILKKFGVTIETSNDFREFFISLQKYRPIKCIIPGDYSSAAYFLAAGALCGDLTVTCLNKDSVQGDKSILDTLIKMGTKVKINKNNIVVKKSELNSVLINAEQSPDLVPIQAVLATQAKGTTRITNASRLRFKESNRLCSIVFELQKMGANIKEKHGGLIIKGPTGLKGSMITSCEDHRISMACAIAGLVAEGKTVINNSSCVNKSYPTFFDDLESVGGVLL